MDEKIFKELNEQQLEAIQSTEGPLLILAGPGSGKTLVLTHRIAYLIAHRQISPEQILAVTFTNKAAQEMRLRTEELTGLSISNCFRFLPRGNSKSPFIGTFHSFAARILRKEIHYLGLSPNFVIYDESDQQNIIKEVLRSIKIDEKQFQPRMVLSKISSAKNNLYDPEDLQEKASDYFTERVAEIYPHYQKTLQRNNALDFDDLLMYTIKIFENIPEVLDYYHNLFYYFMVDEYQDTNNAQYVLMNLLAGRHRNLCVVGDDWQGIYSWRGANIQNILDFKKDYPEAVEIKLEQNYRSTKIILQASQSIIEKNEYRTDKTIWTHNEMGSKVVVCKVEDERQEGQFIIHMIRAIRDEQKICAVLYRTNAQSRALEETFYKRGIPYRIVKGIRFYERKEIKDILAYLFLIVNPYDSINMLRVINVPLRRIGKVTIDKITKYSNTQNISFYQSLGQVEAIDGLAPATRDRLLQFKGKIDGLRNDCVAQGPTFAIEQILIRTGYEDYVRDGTEEGEERFENIKEIFSVANKYENYPGSIEAFLEEVALVSDADTSDNSSDVVLLMTLHSAKGLEFDYVFMVGMEENIFPHNNSIYSNIRFEEERRLCYVGMTRAKKRLYMIYANQRTIYGSIYRNYPSRYIKDIPPDLVEFKKWPQLFFVKERKTEHNVSSEIKKSFNINTTSSSIPYKIGDRVRHQKYGAGMIVSIRDDLIQIAFPSKGVKKFSVSKAPIEKIE